MKSSQYLITQYCLECHAIYENNGRNAQKRKRFCSNACCSKWYNREYRRMKKEEKQ